MKKSFLLLIIAAAASLGITSCSEGSTGLSIFDTTADVVKDSTFTVTGQSVKDKYIQSRTTRQLLGVIKAEDYGVLKSDFVTQFMPANAMDTANVKVENIDSVRFHMRIPMGGYFGDSIVPMRVNVYKLNKLLPFPIYSNFDPKDYYDEKDLIGSTSYSASGLSLPDSIKLQKYREIVVDLPLQMGVDFYNEYLKNPATFKNPEAFAKYFPGVYVTTSYGNGRMMNINSSIITLYYHKRLTIEKKDTTIYYKGEYFATTPEVVTNNNINLEISDKIQSKIDNGEAIIQSPTGYDVAINFPTQEIIDRYNAALKGKLGVINNVYFEIPAEALNNDYKIAPPPSLLLVRANEKDKFFQSDMLNNEVTAYYAKYNKSSKKYIFTEMRDFIIDIIKEKKGIATEEDKNLLLIPVDIIIEQDPYYGNTTITGIKPYVAAPSVTKLNLDKAKVRITFSKQTSRY